MSNDRHLASMAERAFDDRVRALHARALEQLPGRTRLQLQLRPPRAPAPAVRKRLHAWPLAATCALCLVVGGLVLRHPLTPAGTSSPEQPSPTATAVSPGTEGESASAYIALDESPELYLWLASEDNEPLALE